MIDLKELMEDRTHDEPSMGHLRLSQVQQRIVKQRRRRMATAVAVIALLLVTGYQILPTLRSTPPTLPAATPSPAMEMVNGFPRYANGARVVASATLAPSASSITLTWVATKKSISVFQRCPEQDEGMHVLVYVESPRVLVWASQCRESGTDVEVPQIVVGEQFSITVTFSAPANSPFWMPDRPGDYAVAVGESVPFADYPLPPRPDKLKALSSSGKCQHVPSRPGDPLAPVSFDLVWKEMFVGVAESQTPGRLRIAINGIEASSIDFWDYEKSKPQILLNSAEWWATAGELMPVLGETVTVTVTPQYVTGEWQLLLLKQALIVEYPIC